MNPRVSRSSALASKATGFPIAKIAALLAIGYTLDEIQNDITKVTPASFEPTIDYVVVKIPRFAFEKFPGSSSTLGTQMKSVGEVMAIGGTFKEAFQKGLRGLEIGATRLLPQGGHAIPASPAPPSTRRWRGRARIACSTCARPSIRAAPSRTSTRSPRSIRGSSTSSSRSWMPRRPSSRRARRQRRRGLASREAAWLLGRADRRSHRRFRSGRSREAQGASASRRSTSGSTPAPPSSSRTRPISTRPTRTSARPTRPAKRKVMILGSGPNRIGQGIEFDYCCCHASFAFHEEGCETLMVNCNPETVSTDYDTSDRLYFEPLTFEDVMNIIEREKPDGVVIQFGGQTPLKLALPLFRAGVPIWGTSPDMIDLAEDRKRFAKLLDELKIPQPESGTALSIDEAREVARRIGYPVLVRPVLRSRRPGHGHRLHRRRPRRFRAGSGEGLARPSDPRRPFPRRRLRSRCGRPGRRRARDHRRHPRAHRGGGHPQRRLRHGPAHLQGEARAHRHHPRLHPPPRPRPERARPDERPVRDQGRQGLRDRGESARLAHHALHLQGHRRSHGQGRGEDRGRPDPRGARPHQRSRGEAHLREGVGASLREVPGQRHPARAGDEVDRRGHGHRAQRGHGLRQGPGRGGDVDPHERHGVHLRARQRQAGCARDGPLAPGVRFQHRGDPRHRGVPSEGRGPGGRRSRRSARRSPIVST